MDKKPSKRRKQSLLVAPPGAALPQRPFCVMTDSEKSALSIMDQLFRSHAELCMALRFAGRKMLAFERQDHPLLEQLRRVLKRGDNIRKTLRIPDGLPTMLEARDQLEVESPRASKYSGDEVALVVNHAPVRKRIQKRTRLARSHSLGILKFPTS